MRIGFHFPFSGNVKKLKEQIQWSRGNTFQIFVRGLRGGKQQDVTPQKKTVLQNFLTEKNIQPIVVHAPYTYNLANDENQDILKMQEDMNFLQHIGAKYYVIHPGYKGKQHPQIAIEKIKRQLSILLKDTEWDGMILIKNMAGAGTEIGATLSEWNELISFHDRIKGALDFGRLWESGIDFTTKEGANAFYETFDLDVGWEKIFLLYCNDTLTLAGQKKNKPVPLGEGVIGFDGYRFILSESVLKEKIWLIENQPTLAHYDRTISFLTSFYEEG